MLQFGGRAALSRDGTRVLSGVGKKLQLWDAVTGQLIRDFKATDASVRSVAFSEDATLALVGERQGGLRLYDVNIGKLVRTFEGHSRAASAVAFSHDGTRVVSSSDLNRGDDVEHKVWSVSTGQLLSTLEGKRREAN